MCGTNTTNPSVPASASSGGGCCGQARNAGPQRQSEPSAGATVSEYLVDGMTCGGCASSVSGALAKLDGVSDVQIALVPRGASKVTVYSAAPLPERAVSAAVSEAGYRFAGRS